MLKQKLFNLIKKIITFVLKFIFIKKNYKKISFISFPDLSDNCWYLFNYINNNRENLILVWLIDKNLSKTKINTLKKKIKNNKLLFIKKKKLKRYLSLSFITYCFFYSHTLLFFTKKFRPNSSKPLAWYAYKENRRL